MKIKTFITFLLMAIYGIAVTGQTIENDVTKVILSGYSARIFTDRPVTDNQINTIVECGLRAPSARNMQPWKFTVVKNNDLNAKIIQGINTGNILILISAPDAVQPVVSSGFDCGLAMQNMYVAAHSLGLGAHIYMAPVANVNSTMKQTLEIPEGYSVIAILRVGNVDAGVDAVSSASTRKPADEMVNYK